MKQERIQKRAATVRDRADEREPAGAEGDRQVARAIRVRQDILARFDEIIRDLNAVA